MPVDGLFIHKQIQELSILKSGRINRINQISPTDYIFIIHANSKNYNLFITIHTELAHINLTTRNYEIDKNTTNLTILFKKYMEGGILTDINDLNNDRIVKLSISKFNEIGDKMNISLYIELMGRHSNIVLCEGEKIITAYKYVSPFESETRTVLPNVIYKVETNKINPYLLSLDELKNEFENIHSPKDLVNRFNGVSTYIGNYTYNNYELFYKLINEYQPTVYESGFYFIDISFIDGNRKHYNSLSELLDEYYYNKTKENEKKIRSNNLLHFVKSKLEKQERKLANLNNDLLDAQNNEIYRIKGEILFANIDKVKQGSNVVSLYNYYEDANIDIELDPAISVKRNAQKYFAIYGKKKNALKIIPEQIELTKDEIEYYKILESQIEVGSIEDILGISNELNPKPKKAKVKVSEIKMNDYTIYIGKNNEQNALLTKQIAKASDLWFHVYNAPSSHIVLSGLANEESIRLCAMLASYYSKFRYSSSVPVIYTQVKYLKRVPKKRNCFVTYSNEKTIYIDPDIEYIEKLNIS